MRSLPEPVAQGLLLCSSGRFHLEALARCPELSGRDAAHARLARDLLLAAWEADPLDPDLAREVLATGAATGKTALAAQAVVRACRMPVPPWEAKAFAGLARDRDHQGLARFLDDRLHAEPVHPHWVRQAVVEAQYTDGHQWLGAHLEVLRTRDEAGLSGLWAGLQADAMLCLGRVGAAMDLYAKAIARAGLALHSERLGRALLDQGRRNRGLAVWGQVLAVRPWHTGLVLRMADILEGLDTARTLPKGRVAILLYSYNKDRELDRTLETLAASDLGSALVRVLDNGSTDDTGAVLARWQGRMGDRLAVIRTRVNVGAPAARNWLASLDEVRAGDYAVFLDDDVDLPRDWLTRLGAAMEAWPGAGVWGCRVVDGPSPARIQSADTHLTEPPEDAEYAGGVAYRRRFGLSLFHLQEFDYGQFAYVRPCASVTGCCHALGVPVLARTGGFALGYAPSQYDDVDHDLRLCLDGTWPVYQGHLSVRHMKRTGRIGLVDPAEKGRSLANMFALQMRQNESDVVRMREEERNILWRHLARRMEVLAVSGMAPDRVVPR